MSTPIQRMENAEYAFLQSSLGMRIVKSGGVYWRQVRPFFYRPIVPHQSFDIHNNIPRLAGLGGYQYAVQDIGLANSTMNFLFFNRTQEYSLDSLDHCNRRRIKAAMKLFEVQPIDDRNLLINHGHHIYLSFFERTQYHYRRDRLQKEHFQHWIDAIFNAKKSIILGGFHQGTLVAISISYWLGSTIIYSSIICETNARKKGLGDVMLHRLREIAAITSGVTEILARQYQGGNGMDAYYLQRDCQLVKTPSRLVMNPVVLCFLRSFLPKQYDLLCGKF